MPVGGFALGLQPPRHSTVLRPPSLAALVGLSYSPRGEKNICFKNRKM